MLVKHCDYSKDLDENIYKKCSYLQIRNTISEG